MPAITAPVPYQYLFDHLHELLVYDLPGLYNSFLCAQGYLIAAYFGQVVVELRTDREEKARLNWKQEHKVPHDLFGTVPVYLLNLDQAALAGDLPPF